MPSRIALGAPPPLMSLLKSGPTALFLDFDGTLVELASGPDAIRPVDHLSARLQTLSDRLGNRCALVSGRAIADIERHVGPLPVAVAGSHGSDIRDADGAMLGNGPEKLPKVIEASLREYARSQGLDYEHKPHGGALHYRSNLAAGPAAHAFAEALADEHGWAAQSGKCVVELVAAGSTKGGAVNAFMSVPPFSGATPFFLGDDLTDEAGFRACHELGGAGILVGDRAETTQPQTTAAQYALPNVAAVHEWLEL